MSLLTATGLLVLLGLTTTAFVPHTHNTKATTTPRRTQQQRQRKTSTMVVGRMLRRWTNGEEPVNEYCTTKAAVVGASGNVGKVVTARLLEEGYCVTAIVRSWSAGDALYDFLMKVHVCPNLPEIIIADVTDEESERDLKTALKGAERVVVCTGTTAFPTKAWAGGRVQQSDVGGTVLKSLWEHSFDVAETREHLTRELGMNTPARVDGEGVERVARCLDGRSLRRVVLMSSLGVTRRAEFPFTVLNAMGVLDAKARGEDAIVRAAENLGAEWTIVRPGQLFGPPFDNNVYLGTLFELDKSDRTQALTFHKGDASKGDTLRHSLANVLVHSLDCTATKNCDFTVLTSDGEKPDKSAMDQQLHDVLLPGGAVPA
mmetsp:Transcript_2834/g.8533  ORF Transcript_2834/g.8533 Transcript_2834/m.8533 type:complete len:373 (-) Transcript_2834:257-1375(-)